MPIEPHHDPFTEHLHQLTRGVVPAWRRATTGEARWSVSTAALLAIILQLFLPERLTVAKSWMLPAVEGILLVGLLVANPRTDTHSRGLRSASLVLIAAMTFANTCHNTVSCLPQRPAGGA